VKSKTIPRSASRSPASRRSWKRPANPSMTAPATRACPHRSSAPAAVRRCLLENSNRKARGGTQNTAARSSRPPAGGCRNGCSSEQPWTSVAAKVCREMPVTCREAAPAASQPEAYTATGRAVQPWEVSTGAFWFCPTLNPAVPSAGPRPGGLDRPALPGDNKSELLINNYTTQEVAQCRRG
jgi:hypothetical protein